MSQVNSSSCEEIVPCALLEHCNVHLIKSSCLPALIQWRMVCVPHSVIAIAVFRFKRKNYTIVSTENGVYSTRVVRNLFLQLVSKILVL